MITILRLGHRPGRDERISTHCGLVARALGAKKIIYSGERDDGVAKSIKDVSERWGSGIKVEYCEKWKQAIKKFRGTKVHLTMYGLPIQKQMAKIRKSRNVLVIIGGEKVPRDVYDMADYNISVTNQPHSEVAALAIFLHEYHRGKELSKTFPRAKIKIVPQAHGKKVIEK